MRRAPLIAAVYLLLGGCTTHSAVHCKVDGDCAKYGGALCVSGLCEQVDMKIAPGDMTVLDGPAMCSDASICGIALPICGPDEMCHKCVAGDDAACASRNPKTPKCDTASGQCVGCQVNADCGGATPVCNSDGTCRACQGDGECDSNICSADGSCVDMGDVVYVNNVNGTCSTAVSHNGSQNDGYCDINTGIANLGNNKHFVRVAGSSAPYPHVTITGGSFTLSGPTIGSARAMIGDLTANAAIAVSGVGTSVTIDGIAVTGSGAGQAGIACSNTSQPGSTLTIRRASVTNITGTGITASTCTVSIDRTQVGPSNLGGGAVQLNATKYSITNSFIVGNAMATSAAVVFGSNCTATGDGFAFNTVAGNTRTTPNAGGIACTDTTPITSSIIWGNSLGATGSQLSGSCMASNLDINDSTPPPGNNNLDLPPDFKNAAMNDYHLNGLTTGNRACCVDKLAEMPAPGSMITHDFDGTSRPQPSPAGKWDIGAHEVMQ